MEQSGKAGSLSCFSAFCCLRSSQRARREKVKEICMTQRSATIKVLCRMDALHDAANMLQWALGHQVMVDEETSDSKVGCLFVFTNIEYYDNDATIFEQFGFDIIGKIRGVVSWEVFEAEMQKDDADASTSTDRPAKSGEQEELEVELMRRLCTLPITISVMPRMEGKFAWKCLEASGHAETFAEALEAALTHFTRVFKLIRSELLG